MSYKKTKHQALQDLLDIMFGKDDYCVESGFEGDTLWATIQGEERQFGFEQENNTYEDWQEDEEIDHLRVMKSDEWYFWPMEDDGPAKWELWEKWEEKTR